MLNEKQIRLINWMYNLLIVEMKLKPETFLASDQTKLKESIERRFPEHSKEILKPFE